MKVETDREIGRCEREITLACLCACSYLNRPCRWLAPRLTWWPLWLGLEGPCWPTCRLIPPTMFLICFWLVGCSWSVFRLPCRACYPNWIIGPRSTLAPPPPPCAIPMVTSSTHSVIAPFSLVHWTWPKLVVTTIPEGNGSHFYRQCTWPSQG